MWGMGPFLTLWRVNVTKKGGKRLKEKALPAVKNN